MSLEAVGGVDLVMRGPKEPEGRGKVKVRGRARRGARGEGGAAKNWEGVKKGGRQENLFHYQ